MRKQSKTFVDKGFIGSGTHFPDEPKKFCTNRREVLTLVEKGYSKLRDQALAYLQATKKKAVAAEQTT